jgi:hypothetical protein
MTRLDRFALFAWLAAMMFIAWRSTTPPMYEYNAVSTDMLERLGIMEQKYLELEENIEVLKTYINNKEKHK